MRFVHAVAAVRNRFERTETLFALDGEGVSPAHYQC